jgi:hypothetical protein
MHKVQKIRKGIILFLLLMIIGLSVFFYYYLINMDKKYSGIIKNEVTLYNNVQEITFGANRGYFLLYKIIGTNNLTKRDSLIIQKNLILAKNDSLINDILFALIENKDRSSLNQLISFRQEYVNNCARFKEYIAANKKDSANYILINEIDQSFQNYQKELISFIDANSSNVIEHSGNITSDVKRHSFIVLLFGLSPVIIFSLFLMILGIFLILMIFFIKDVEYKRYGK